MDKRAKIIVFIFIAVLVGICITEVVRPKPMNWKPSYSATDKIPFGCFVLFKELPVLFPKTRITNVDESLYNVLPEQDASTPSNYLMINDIISLDDQENNQLLNYVSQGNDVFIAATDFGSSLSDTLGLTVQSFYGFKEDSITVSLANSTFKNSSYTYSKGQYKSHFTKVDTLHTTILGYVEFSADQEPLFSKKPDETKREANFIKTQFGKGNFYLSTLPQAYTNYYVLSANKNYVAHTFSYLSNRNLYWDNYKKSGRVVINSPMRFILKQASLKWAYYLTVLGLLVFVIFKAKREQRIIPELTPLENTSVEFARTVGSLYYQHRDYSDLISKKLNYFQEFIRSRYYIDMLHLSDSTSLDLAVKSGKSIAESKALVDFMRYLKSKKVHTVEDLIQLNKKITLFKQ